MPVAKAMTAANLAQRVHRDGFVVLPTTPFQVAQSIVDIVRTQVLMQYEECLTHAADQQLDLTCRDHFERLSGFYVRPGGRVDMELKLSAFETSLDGNLLKTIMTTWQSVVTEVFAPATCHLEYIGCVISRPGDGDQNWHLDGVHRHQKRQEMVDRLNVFVPLVAITDETGGTEMKTRSHLHNHGARGISFEGYKDLPSVTAKVEAGTPIIMDYRVWHRGLANTSEKTVRPLLYFKYAKVPTPVDTKTLSACTKKRKRITPMVV